MKFAVALYPTATLQFLEESTQILRTEASRRSYREMLRLLQGLHPDKRVDKFTEGDLVAFLNRPGSPNTVAQRRKIVTKFFSWATWRGLVQRDPTLGLKRLVPINRQPVMHHHWLNEDEIRRLLATTNGKDPRHLRDRTILLLGLLTGLRRFEMSALNWGDLDLNDRSLRLVGKGQKIATVGLPVQLVEHLMEWRGHVARGLGRPVTATDPVLTSFHFGSEAPGITGIGGSTTAKWTVRLGVSGIADVVAILGERAGVLNLAPHDLRRTFAGVLEERGKSIDQISKALRHSNVAVTQKYLESNPKKTMAVTEDLVLDL